MMRTLSSRLFVAVAMGWVALIRSSQHWRPGLRNLSAQTIGFVLWLVVVRRRRIVNANLSACFPQWSSQRRRHVARRLFCRMARSVLDYGILWYADKARLQTFVRTEGIHHLKSALENHQPLIVLAPHFVGLDAGGIRIATEQRVVSIYARQSNPVWDQQLRQGRSRFNEPVLIPRRGADLRTAIRAMREGLPFYYLPDMDNGDANSIFVPFFGVEAATLPMVTRLAKTVGARVVLAVTEQVDDGYVLHISAPWDAFPGDSIEADTERMNQEIEAWVQKLPDQYLWTHRRFKTRPHGAPSIYH